MAALETGTVEHGPLEGDRSGRARLVIAGLCVGLCLAILLALMTGPTGLASLDALTSILSGRAIEGPEALRDRIILADIRFPRMVVGVFVGAGLAVSGVLMQGLFRNPLADPGIVGVSSGAGLGAALMIVAGTWLPAWLMASLGILALPLAAFLGALGATALLYRIGTRGGYTDVATMLLAGLAVAALAQAAIGFLIFTADERQLRDINFWLLGSLSGATEDKILMCAPLIAAVLLAMPFLARGLNALVLGEAAAGHLGIPVQRLKRLSIIAVAAATGAGVAVSGGIGFVGIVVPHLLRLTIGPDHRYLLPASALLGASLLLVADTIARTIVAPAELPIGILTALAGAPFFLWILLTRRGFALG